MFNFNDTLDDIVKSSEENIQDISLKLINPCEIFYYMYGIPFKGIPIGNNGFYEITNISPFKYYLYNQNNNFDKVYSDIVFEYILHQHLNQVGLNTINHAQIKELHLRYSDFMSYVFSNEYFTVLWTIPRNDKRYAQYFIKCNKLPPTIKGSDYYEVLNELLNTSNYIASYRKIFRLDEKGSYSAACNKMLNDPFLFCKNNNKAYFIYYTKHLDYVNFYSFSNLDENTFNLLILLGTDYNNINWIIENLCNINLPVTTSAIINGKDTNIAISDKVYDEVPSYVQKIFKSQLGINKDKKTSEYTMRAIVIDL